MDSKGLLIKSCAAAVFGLFSLHASAATLTLDLGISFGDVPADGTTPWLTATFDDGGSPGSVDLTLKVSDDIGAADITQVYLNLNPALALANLTIMQSSGVANMGISISENAFKADGDGFYDILIDFANDTFSQGLTSSYSITSTDAIVASSFNFWSSDTGIPGGTAGAHGPFLAAAKVQSTGPSPYNDSDWIGAVPVPAAVWLFGSGLLGLVGVARRRRA